MAMCKTEVIKGIKEYEEFEMIPAPMEKWMKRSIIDEEEAEDNELLYEEGLQAMVDPWQEWTRQEERLIEDQVGFGLIPEEVNHDKGDWPRIKKITGIMIIDKIEGFYLSHLESANPYYAGPFPKRSNVDKEQLLHDNRVPRKFTDQVTVYMGNPTYTGSDRLIYTDIYGHIDGISMHIRTTNNINTIECAMIHTNKGTVKAVCVKNGFIGELDMGMISRLERIPILKTTIKAMFDTEGNALSYKTEKSDMDIKGCNIEISYLKEDDCLFDQTRQLQIEEKKTNTNKYIDMRIQSLRKRISKVVDNYKMGYISEERATMAVNKYKTAIKRLNAKRI